MSTDFYTELWAPLMESSNYWEDIKDEGPIKWSTLTVSLSNSCQKSLVDDEETAYEMLAAHDQHPRQNLSCFGLGTPNGPPYDSKVCPYCREAREALLRIAQKRKEEDHVANDITLDQLLMGTSSQISIDLEKIAAALAGPLDDKYSRKKTIQVLEKISTDRFKAVVTMAQSLFTDRMDGDDKVEIISALGTIPVERFEDIMAAAQSLVTDRMDGRCKADIIISLGKLPADRFKDIVTAVRSLYTDPKSGGTEARVISKLGNLPTDRFEDIVTAARSLFTDATGEYKGNIIIALGKVPANLFEQISNLLLLLITP